MAELSIDDFEEFFAQVWPGFDPFRWQSDLVRLVHEERRWPDLVDLPTGSGKTSLVDIGVFLLALDAAQPAEHRWMPRRIVLVVDRRVVVDQAEQRGSAIARVLSVATDGVVRSVADRLRSLSGDRPPLVTTVLRGGIVRDETWARRPDVPAIISSTVDQVGSRLFFRGYGVSSSIRPIHAGLLGNDVLLLLDEVHLARPFAESLEALRGYRHWREGGRHSLPDRWHVVQLTATPTIPAERRFPAERLDPGSHPVLSRRLLASKPARLEVAKVAKDSAKANEQLATHCVKLARTQMQLGHVNTLAVIVNRVDAARHAARQLAALSDLDVVLLTGRMRSLDRDRILEKWDSRLRLGRTRQPSDKPLIVVATQSIEAGADFDFDGVVTECASLDALRQRFGRVDRDGQLSQTGEPSSSVIVIRSTDVNATEPDPVYGDALTNTWAWLKGLDEVDFGIEALAERLEHVDQHPLVPPLRRAPRLHPGHLDQWVQTSQQSPSTEADVGRWLHGIDQDDRLADVELVWRADLHPSLLMADLDSDHEEEISARVAACPPVSGEALSVSIVELRRWAAGEPSDPSASDATGGGKIEDDGPRQGRHGGYLRWSRGRAERVSPGEVRPGDTLLVPAALGGMWLDNWDPSSVLPVIDIALDAMVLVRRRAVARLSPDVFADRNDLPDPEVLGHESKRDRASAIKLYLALLAADASNANDDRAALVFRHLSRPDCALRISALAEGFDDAMVRRSYVVTTTKKLSRSAADLAPDDGADAVSFTGVRSVTLDSHLRGVGEWAALLARNVGLGKELVADLRLAGRLHDLGKADSRFQEWLRGGDYGGPAELLAKSSTPDVDQVARQRARERSGYPWGARHELLSYAMIQDPRGPISTAHDPDLVRFLVASHHGFGRYRYDPCLDLAPETVRFEIDGAGISASSDHGLCRLDTGVADLFWRLVRRYGWYGLTWLEAILRLADHARSRAEQEHEIDQDALAEAMVT